MADHSSKEKKLLKKEKNNFKVIYFYNFGELKEWN